MTDHDHSRPTTGAHRGGHGLMMIACCLPMLLIAVVLVATGTAGVSFLLIAVACTAMMALMMRGMQGQDRGRLAAGDQAAGQTVLSRDGQNIAHDI